MDDKEINKLKEISQRFRKMSGKIKLITLLKRAKNEFDKNHYAECQYTCEEILKKHPNNSIALRGIGCVMQSKGKFSEAYGYYNKALEFSENKEIEYTLLGTICYLQNDLDKAIEYYNLAIDINDNYDSAYEGRNQAMLENHLNILDLQDNLVKRELF